MKQELIEFLIFINNGKMIGSQKKLAEYLGITETAVSNWLNFKAVPSKENISKMAELSGKTEEEIQNIFNLKNNLLKDGNLNSQKSNDLKDKEIELLKKEIELLKKEIEILKSGKK